MEAASTDAVTSPLAQLLRARVQEVLSSWEASGETSALESGRMALRRFVDALDELVEAAAALAAPASARDPAGLTVLLAADDAPFAQSLREMLEPHARVEVANDPQHARRKAVARTPTVLFAAGSTAQETLQGIRELHPGLNAVLAGSDAEMSRLLDGLDEEPAVLLPASVGAPAIALAIRAILFASSSKPHKRRASARAPGRTRWAGELPAKPQSYAHLAGLLPRALERTVDFDVGAAVIARPGGDPIVDVHATRDCPGAMLQLVRDRALALFQVTSGHASRTADDPSSTSGDLVASAIHVPLVAEGRVVGLTYLASSRPDAFGLDDRRVLAELAANASGAYRRLESTVRRLRLTPRQSQVLSLIASGLSDKEVGQRLGLAHRTVRTHIDRLLREHGLRSRTEAVAAWLRGQQE